MRIKLLEGEKLADPDQLSDRFSTDTYKVLFRPLTGNKHISERAVVGRVGKLLVWYGDSSTGLKVISRCDQDFYTIMLPGSGSATILSDGKQSTAHNLQGATYRLLHGDSVEYNPHQSFVWVRVPTPLILTNLSELIDKPVISSSILDRSIDITSIGGIHLRSLAISALTLELEEKSISQSPIAEAALETAILHTLIENFSNVFRQHSKHRAPTIAPRQVRRVIEYLEAHSEEAIVLSRLAKIAGVSPRALQQSFKSFVGHSPMRHLMITRLRNAHRELCDTNSHLSIADIAQKWGFPSPSRFSSLIKSTFGETPRQIRQRRKR